MLINIFAETNYFDKIYIKIITEVVITLIASVIIFVVKKAKEYLNDSKSINNYKSARNWIKDVLTKQCFQNADVKSYDRQISSLKMCESFILHGGAGTGKSMLLRNHYLHTCKKERFAQCLFYDSSMLNAPINVALDTINQNIISSRFRNIFIYLDGIDETDKANEQFFEMIINRYPSKKIYFRISCRDKFFDQIANSSLQSEQHLFENFYTTIKWSDNALIRYVECLITNDGLLTEYNKSELIKIFKEMPQESWSIIDNSPLMCQLLYNIIKNNHNYKLESNKFAFYKSFFLNSVLVNYPAKDSKLLEFAQSVFDVFDNHRYLEYNKVFEYILKPFNISEGNYALLKHETFKEFLIAYCYNESLENIDYRTINVISHAYTNDIADFITEGLLLKNVDEMKNAFIRLYNYTKEDNSENLDELNSAIRCLSAEKFFRLKYEIIFRLGRLHYDSVEQKKTIINFLTDIYMNDNNISNLPSDNTDYWLAVLKRCCAISSSFLCGYDIEMDYVEKMLDWRHKQYQPNFDLANRSHTLYFYGDIVNDNDIFGYIDREANCSCDKALHKRINRLSQINDKTDIDDMTDKELRKYCFRLFDIATIYTFIKSRINHPELLNLTDKDKEIIKTFKTDFIDRTNKNSSRTVLLNEIKNKTIELL